MNTFSTLNSVKLGYTFDSEYFVIFVLLFVLILERYQVRLHENPSTKSKDNKYYVLFKIGKTTTHRKKKDTILTPNRMCYVYWCWGEVGLFNVESGFDSVLYLTIVNERI